MPEPKGNLKWSSHAFPTLTLDGLQGVRLFPTFTPSWLSHAAQSPDPVEIW